MSTATDKNKRYVYSPEYIETVFYVWYKHRGEGQKNIVILIPPDQNGVKPSTQILELWRNNFDWENRASNLDFEASKKMDISIIDERIKMFEEHAKIGGEIKDFGLTYLRAHGINGDIAALRAIADGIQIERSSRGLADSLARLAELDDTKLLKEINRLLEVQQNTIDAEVEDITEEEDKL